MQEIKDYWLSGIGFYNISWMLNGKALFGNPLGFHLPSMMSCITPAVASLTRSRFAFAVARLVVAHCAFVLYAQ